MVAVHIFAINTKNYMFKNLKNFNRGEISFGAEILLFILVLFVIWILFGQRTPDADKPFIKSQPMPSEYIR